jgi:hypothetical protein
MGQSQRGATKIMEAQMRPLVVAIPRFIQLALIEPSALRAAKAYAVE